SRPGADASVLLRARAPPLAAPRHGAIGRIGDLTGHVEQSTPVDDDTLVEVAAVIFHVVLFEQGGAGRRAWKVDDELDLDEHGRIGQSTHDQTRRSRAGAFEELGALGTAARIVRLDIRHVDQLLHDGVEFGPGLREDGSQPPEGPPGLRRHATGDETPVRVAPRQPGGEQDPRGIDTHPGHETTALLDRTLGENLSAIHDVLLPESNAREIVWSQRGQYCAGRISAVKEHGESGARPAPARAAPAGRVTTALRASRRSGW